MAELTITVLVLVLVVGMGVVVTAVRMIRIVPQHRVGLVERLGRYRRTLQPGVSLLAPFIDQVRTLVDTREQELDVAPAPVITADNAAVEVEVRLRYRIVDPVQAVYAIADYREGLDQLTVAALRDLLGGELVHEAQANHHQLGDDVRVAIGRAAGAWGIEVVGAEIRAMARR